MNRDRKKKLSYIKKNYPIYFNARNTLCVIHSTALLFGENTFLKKFILHRIHASITDINNNNSSTTGI